MWAQEQSRVEPVSSCCFHLSNSNVNKFNHCRFRANVLEPEVEQLLVEEVKDPC